MADPWFIAELRNGEVHLLRKAPSLTGHPGLDAFADRGARYALTLGEARHLRDALTDALGEVPDVARKEERAAVVAWLHGEAQRLNPLPGALSVDRVACAIERGDHVAKAGT